MSTLKKRTKPSKQCTKKCPFPTSCAQSGTKQLCRTNTGLLVGLSIVAVLLIIVICAGLFFLRWRRRRAQKRREREAATISLSRQNLSQLQNAKRPKEQEQQCPSSGRSDEDTTSSTSRRSASIVSNNNTTSDESIRNRDDTNLDAISVMTGEEQWNPPDRVTPRPSAPPLPPSKLQFYKNTQRTRRSSITSWWTARKIS